jgi:hypothetical protein
MKTLMDELVPVLSTLQKIYDVGKIRGVKTWSKIDAQIISTCAEALKLEYLNGIVHVLQSLCTSLYTFSSWLGGCHDHQYILDAMDVAYSVKYSRWRRESQNCIWRGRRLVELISGSLRVFLRRIRTTHSKGLKEHLANSDNVERSWLLELFTIISEKVCFAIEEKCTCFFNIPMLFLGCLSHLYAGHTEEHSKKLLGQAFSELDNAIARGDSYRLDRISVRIAVGPNNLCEQELREFLNGDGRLGATAHGTLRHYALGKCISRRVEAQHSRIRRVQNKHTRVSPHFVNVALKSPELEISLENINFYSYACSHFRTRNLWVDVVSFACRQTPRWQLRSIRTTKELKDAVHMSSSDLQYRDIATEQKALVSWKTVGLYMLQPKVDGIVPIVWMMVDFLKNFFKEASNGTVFSVPAELLDTGSVITRCSIH